MWLPRYYDKSSSSACSVLNITAWGVQSPCAFLYLYCHCTYITRAFQQVDPVNDRADPKKGATRLLALFPGVVSDVGGVYAASSQDGVNFTNPKLWLHSRKVCPPALSRCLLSG